MGNVGEWWARTFEPEGTGGYSGYGGEEERRQETKKFEEEAPAKAAAAAQQEIDDASLKAEEAILARKKRLLTGSKSVYTSPLGLQDEATTYRKQLLGD